MENPMNNPELKEGEMTKKIEDMTAQLPSKFFLCTAVGLMASSAILKCTGHKHWALFVGQWVSPILLMGIYNKIVKTSGHD
ncbi:hypothetical protein [Sphingobacterium lactis]|uniref:Uncharacterized protein n=1 Tax=Sphingobacterium lactis TaxID=797291 RepID=A0A1H6CJG9_9SPHI|nr:hypothetical protein [Sphingobacterium lactis]SEG72907.1 hypothetical protein SAMN05421877_11617 [Sphingobacterium lactis]